MNRYLGAVAGLAVVMMMPAVMGYAQRGGGGGRGGAPPTAQATSPVDLTGYWVSVVTEDWRWRMITPAKGDHPSVPLNPAGVKLADSWDPAKDTAAGEQCKAYGAAGVMRLPGRLHITWADGNTLKIEAEAGTQTRMIHFMGGPAQQLQSVGAAVPGVGADMAAPSWQGLSLGVWEAAGGGGRGGARGPADANPMRNNGDLKVVTTHMKPGYLQKNGVPYSDTAVQTEYFSRTFEPNGDSWLILTHIVSDPTYLNADFVRTTHYKKLADNNTTWEPEPCSAQ